MVSVEPTHRADTACVSIRRVCDIEHHRTEQVAKGREGGASIMSKLRIFADWNEVSIWMDQNCKTCAELGHCGYFERMSQSNIERNAVGHDDTWIDDELADRLGYTPFGDWQCKVKEV